MLVVPYLCGTLEIMVLRERNAGHLKTYVTGLLSLFAYFLFAILVSLKLDLSFEGLKCLFLTVPAGISIVAIPILIIRIRKGLMGFKPSFDRSLLWFVPTAAVLGVLAYVIKMPSFANDNTWEVVSTTLETNTYYEISAFTGDVITNALPIFVKIYVMPMFYAVLCRTFGFEMWFIAGLIIPILFYVLNLCLMYSISGELLGEKELRSRATFMCAYLLFLLAGTYLPVNGITATVGYALLREGYTGYACAYGVVVPFVILLILQKRYLLAGLSATSILGLLPLDKFFFLVLGSPISFWRNINYSGKLATVYLVSLIFMLYLRMRSGKRNFSAIFFLPAGLISFCIVKASDYVKGRRYRWIYFFGVGFILLSACYFQPMNDAINAPNIRKENAELRTCLTELAETEEIRLWSSDEIMSEARRLNAKIFLAYPRSVYSITLNGLEYEAVVDDAEDMQKFMLNKLNEFDYLVLQKTDIQIMRSAIENGVNCIILPTESLREDFEILLKESGFCNKKSFEGYVAYTYTLNIID